MASCCVKHSREDSRRKKGKTRGKERDKMAADPDMALLDRPEISHYIFYPRRDPQPEDDLALYPVEVEQGISVVCRFYPASRGIATILYFHGNGETAGDYDLVSSLYTALEINLFVADYRGYGLSSGEPTIGHMLQDAHPICERLKEVLRQGGHAEALFVMGRSLGSAPAIELAFRSQDAFKGLIVESGFSDALRLLSYIGLPLAITQPREEGFPNGVRIRSIRIPTLLIHGAEDHLIPLREAEELLRLCAAEEKRLVVIPRADHNTLMMMGRDRYFQAIEGFIKSNL
jgi:alpha-beta hydrolase superfamily lysophospholipase